MLHHTSVNCLQWVLRLLHALSCNGEVSLQELERNNEVTPCTIHTILYWDIQFYWFRGPHPLYVLRHDPVTVCKTKFGYWSRTLSCNGEANRGRPRRRSGPLRIIPTSKHVQLYEKVSSSNAGLMVHACQACTRVRHLVHHHNSQESLSIAAARWSEYL